MGLFRKLTSVSTLGAVDYRSDKERTARKTAKGARYSKQAAQEAKTQTELLRQQTAALTGTPAPAPTRPNPLSFTSLLDAAKERRTPTAAAAPAETGTAERLAAVDALHTTGQITAEEHQAQNARILDTL